LLKVELNELKMLEDEGIKQMYSMMGVLIQNINALDIANLIGQEIIRKILQTLPKPKYNMSRHFSLRRTSLPSPSLWL
jgi:hypothetical protein